MKIISKLFKLWLVHTTFYFILTVIPLIYVRNVLFTLEIPFHKIVELIIILTFSLVMGLMIGSISFFLKYNLIWFVAFILVFAILYFYYIQWMISGYHFTTSPPLDFGRFE